MHLLENFELNLLRDFVRGKGRGTISRVDPLNLKDDDNPFKEVEKNNQDILVINEQVWKKNLVKINLVCSNYTKNDVADTTKK